MHTTICKKCNCPTIEENGRYVCFACGAQYEPVEEPVSANIPVSMQTDFTQFFESVSLEQFRQINQRLVDSVKACGDLYIIAALSDGRYYTRYTPGSNSTRHYTGQCAAENWCGVSKIFTAASYSVGITDKGFLQPTATEVSMFFSMLQSNGISNMRIKQILEMDIYDDTFIGLDVNGRVVINNPFKLFSIDENDANQVAMLAQGLQKIKNWPPMMKLIPRLSPYSEGSSLCGISMDGKLYQVYFREDARRMPAWEDTFCDFSFQWLNPGYYYIGLREDGTLRGYDSRYDDVAEVVQLCAENSGIYYLTKNGDLYFRCECIAHNVIARISCGYVHADGTLHILKKVGGAWQDEEIPNLKLFDSIETFLQEWDDRYDGEDIAQFVEQKRATAAKHWQKLGERGTIRTQIDALGVFQLKDRKQLNADLQKVNEEIHLLEQELSNYEEKLSKGPSGEAMWEIIHSSSPSVTVEQIQSAARNAVAYKPSRLRDPVLRSAAVGAVIAGPTGAIVGAVYAANKKSK